MKAVVQRVARAEVRVDGVAVGSIGPGALVLLGVMKGDGERELSRLAERIASFRFFPDPAARNAPGEGRMERSLLELGLEVLVVSQVTLAADGRKGRRPSLDGAAPPDVARALYDRFADRLAELGLRVARGVFGATMAVELVNDGPVTFVLAEAPPQVVA